MNKPKVVVGIDGSAVSGDALDFAMGEARLRGATLIPVMAIELPDVSWIDPYFLRQHTDADYVGMGEAKLHALLQEAGTEDLDVQPLVTTVPAPTALVTQSQSADLLVVGSHGRGGFRGLVMGSVSLQCVLHAHCPVTVVRPAPKPAEAPAEAPAERLEHTLEDIRRDTTATFL